jgi:hypothetical protein
LIISYCFHSIIIEPRAKEQRAMNTLLIVLAAATLGIDAGWQRLPDGGMEYIIQLDARAIEALQAGEQLRSDIPTEAGEIKAYCIKLGAETLPRETPPPKAVETPATPPPPQPADAAPAKPWLVLVAVLLLLFASLAANVYLAWILGGLRRKANTAS